MGLNDKIENSNTRKNPKIKKSPFKIQNRRRESDAEGPICSGVITYFKSYYEAVMKTRLPLYFGISVYLVICLLGNTVMGIIFWKHHNSSAEITLGDDNFNSTNNLLFDIDLNDTSILDSSLEFDPEFLETYDLDLYHIFINESYNEVRSYYLVKKAKLICYRSTHCSPERTYVNTLSIQF